MCCFPACHLHLLPLLLPALLILICGISHGIIKGAQAEQQQNSQAAGGQQQQQFAQQSLLLPSQQHRGRHRSRRAPAVWGEPAPDYSMAALDPRTHIYLYALLFVDLKTSDHYRREHALVRREVMRMAREANNYFFQINLRLVVVDVLETFRDDLSLYSFEQYRNQRLAQLPFHNFAVLITYRYAGGLAFVGGMCSSKSVMLAGFYPHNPEAMGSIFFHEVAHLVGVPHRPPNETLEVPNCACAGRQAKAGHNGISQTPLGPTGEPVSKSNLMLANQSLRGPGCLKIPGFDQDCSLQLMVNLALRTRCLAREPRPDQWSLPLCGNGLREGNEQCDCGLATKCAEWNCEPQTCARHWPLWAMWLSAFCFCLALAGPGLLCLWLRGQLSPRRAKRRRLLFVRLPSETPGKQQTTGKLHRKLTIGQRQGRGQPLIQSARAIGCRLASMAKPFHALWKRFSGPKSWKGEQLKPSLPTSPSQDTNGLIRRPLKPPPPPPPLANLLSSPNSTLGRPKKPPPPRPPSSRQCLQNLLPSPLASASQLPPPPPPPLIVRPTALPPAPPRQQDQQKRPPPPAEEKLPSPLPEILGSEAEEEDEWDDYCE